MTTYLRRTLSKLAAMRIWTDLNRVLPPGPPSQKPSKMTCPFEEFCGTTKLSILGPFTPVCWDLRCEHRWRKYSCYTSLQHTDSVGTLQHLVARAVYFSLPALRYALADIVLNHILARIGGPGYHIKWCTMLLPTQTSCMHTKQCTAPRGTPHTCAARSKWLSQNA